MSRKHSFLLDPLPQLQENSPRSSRTLSDISHLSFKHWHRQMQSEHDRLQKSSFRLWKWCYKGCRPCRWFDNIEYDKKICKYCLRFRTFKSLGTMILGGAFFYLLMFSIFKEEVLPGGTIFFTFILFLIAYFAGYLSTLVGLPTMLGHLGTGILFGNLPPKYLPRRDDEALEKFAQISDNEYSLPREILLVIALMRAGLLLDFSRLENRIQFVIRLAVIPVAFEILVITFFGHYILSLPWAWGCLQGSSMSIVSLATVITLMEKNRIHGYGEDKHLSTVLIAASALNVICSLFVYVVSASCIFPDEEITFGAVMLDVVEEIFFGVMIGGIAGLLIAFFPDKRNPEAAALRILLIGIGAFALATVFHSYEMTAAAALSCLTLTIVAGNMWEELGWHKITNPVQYFYTVLYYFAQPVVISLLGFTMNFSNTGPKETGAYILILVMGILTRGLVSFCVTFGKMYPTNYKEKLFICIAWCSKGTFQALITFSIKYIIIGNKNLDPDVKTEYLQYSTTIKGCVVIAILLTTPLVGFSLNLLSPKLLSKSNIDSALRKVELHSPEKSPVVRSPSLRSSSIKFEEGPASGPTAPTAPTAPTVPPAPTDTAASSVPRLPAPRPPAPRPPAPRAPAGPRFPPRGPRNQR